MAPYGPHWEAILADAPVGLAVVEAPGRLRWANAAYFRTSGRDPGIVGRELRDLPEDSGSLSAAVRAAIDRALRDQVPATFRSIRASHRGQPGGIYLDLDIHPFLAEPHRTACALLVLHEATERVEEHRLAQLYYSSFETSSNAIEITDAQGVLVDVNPTFERIYGYSRAECIGKKPNLVRSRKTSSALYERMWADLKDPARGFWSGELQNRDRWGKERPVFLTISSVRSEGGEVTHYVAVAIDLAEQRSWELAASHTERLASVGQLAAGVAHEINTPLANVMLVAESLRRRSTDPWVLERLATISGQVEVAAKIVRGLLDFSRRTEPQLSALDLREVARSAVEFLQGKQSENVDLTVSVPDRPVPIWGDRSQLIQVLTNLLNNAYDAMQGVGRIRLDVRALEVDAEIEIVDSGPGIPPDVISHIFEPFFTTKPEGQGTGLGLAICHGIVQTHHGTILARNRTEGGASFLITLPLARGTPPAAVTRPEDDDPRDPVRS